jgi:hypothetical protein
LNPRKDTNMDRWDLDSWDLEKIEGPGDGDEFEPEDDEDYDPHLEVIENLDEERYESRQGWLVPFVRTSALVVLIAFLIGFVLPQTATSIRGFFRRPETPDYLSAVLIDGNAYIFPQVDIKYSIVAPPSYPSTELARLSEPVLRAMNLWEQALPGRIEFTPADAVGADDLLIHYVTDLDTAGVAMMRPGNRYRPEIYIRLNINSPLPEPAIQETVALHELGHALGLWGHSDFDGDCMYPYTGRGTPSARDIRTIRLLYSYGGGN